MGSPIAFCVRTVAGNMAALTPPTPMFFRNDLLPVLFFMVLALRIDDYLNISFFCAC
jgi:hypothetical protein